MHPYVYCRLTRTQGGLSLKPKVKSEVVGMSKLHRITDHSRNSFWEARSPQLNVKKPQDESFRDKYANDVKL